MASLHNAIFCALLATALWTCFGLSLSLRLMPRPLAWAAAPALGWAVHSTFVFPIFCLIGFTRVTVTLAMALSVLTGVVLLWRNVRQTDAGAVWIPFWAVAGAAILAFAIMLMILPQVGAGDVALTDFVFDHSKVAMIDDMARSGVPAGNPFFGESDGLDRLTYYYLWHFSAAELVLLTGCSGWESDAGLTGFTAFSSLLLMMGLSNWFSVRRTAAAWVLILATAYSIRPILEAVLGRHLIYTAFGWPSGFGGWLFQATWAPQHVASAGSVLIATYLLIKLAKRQSALSICVLGATVAAAFESSTWVGGITFPLAAVPIALMILLRTGAGSHRSFVLAAIGAAALSVALASLFIHDQFQASGIRANGSPIGVLPYELLGEATPGSLRHFLDVPLYWTFFLFTELAAIYPTGVILMVRLAKDRLLPALQVSYIAPYGLLGFVSLAVGGILVSQLGGNNDLGWRGILPAILILTIFSGVGLSRYLGATRFGCGLAALILVGLGSYEGIRNLCYNLCHQPSNASLLFEDSAAMWAAVRKQSGDEERIANNPRFLSDVTRWPINISWALMANRRSCYANSGFGPFSPRTKISQDDIEAQFDRIFSGHPETDDLKQLAKRYNCALVVVTSQDGAWKNDPFASSEVFQLVETKTDDWRIYRRR